MAVAPWGGWGDGAAEGGRVFWTEDWQEVAGDGLLGEVVQGFLAVAGIITIDLLFPLPLQFPHDHFLTESIYLTSLTPQVESPQHPDAPHQQPAKTHIVISREVLQVSTRSHHTRLKSVTHGLERLTECDPSG